MSAASPSPRRGGRSGTPPKGSSFARRSSVPSKLVGPGGGCGRVADRDKSDRSGRGAQGTGPQARLRLNVITALHDHFGAESWTAKQAIGELDTDAVGRARSSMAQRPTIRQVGNWLRPRKERVFCLGGRRSSNWLGQIDRVGTWYSAIACCGSWASEATASLRWQAAGSAGTAGARSTPIEEERFFIRTKLRFYPHTSKPYVPSEPADPAPKEAPPPTRATKRRRAPRLRLWAKTRRWRCLPGGGWGGHPSIGHRRRPLQLHRAAAGLRSRHPASGQGAHGRGEVGQACGGAAAVAGSGEAEAIEGAGGEGDMRAWRQVKLRDLIDQGRRCRSCHRRHRRVDWGQWYCGRACRRRPGSTWARNGGPSTRRTCSGGERRLGSGGPSRH